MAKRKPVDPDPYSLDSVSLSEQLGGERRTLRSLSRPPVPPPPEVAEPDAGPRSRFWDDDEDDHEANDGWTAKLGQALRMLLDSQPTRGNAQPAVERDSEGRPVLGLELPDLTAMSSDELAALLKTIPLGPPCPSEWQRVCHAKTLAEWRELREHILAAPEDEPLTLGTAADLLDTSSTALLPWIYKGKLTGTKVPRGPRGFYWTVPAGEVRRYMLERERR